MDKKVTRKEFLVSILSVFALLVLSKVPGILTKKLPLSKSNAKNNAYGNHVYGGGKSA